MRVCYVCDARKERDELDKIPICVVCARIYNISSASSRRKTLEIPIITPDDTRYIDFAPDPTPPY